MAISDLLFTKRVRGGACASIATKNLLAMVDMGASGAHAECAEAIDTIALKDSR